MLSAPAILFTFNVRAVAPAIRERTPAPLGVRQMMALPFFLFFASMVAILRDRYVLAWSAGLLGTISTFCLFLLHATSPLGLNL